MTLRVTHELHDRRRGRNLAVATLLGAFVVLMLALSMVKIRETGPIQGFDHVLRPELTMPAAGTGGDSQ